MHVLQIPSWYPTTEAPWNGIYFVEQARLLLEHGVKMGVIYPEQQSLRRASWTALRDKHFQVEWTDEHEIPTLRRYGWNLWWRFPPGVRLRIRSAFRLGCRYVDRCGVPDLIHAQSARWAGAAAARLSRHFSIPYVLTEHFSGFQRNAVFPWRWPLIEEGYRHANGIAAVSSSLKAAIVAQKLAQPSTVAIHPNPVDGSLFTLPPSSRAEPAPFHFVSVARLRPQKNIACLLDAFAKAFSNQEKVFLNIVGEGPERSLLEHRVERLGIEAQVTFQGLQNRRGVRAALWNAHAFVLPSRFESFGVTLIEAMATGLPVVATASGGPEDLVTRETGLLVPPEDSAALRDALRTLRRTWSTYDPSAIRAYTLDQYGPASFVRRTRSFYRRAMELSA